MDGDHGGDGAVGGSRGGPPGPGFVGIQALSQQSGVSVRNIREYQDRGILPPPERRGRTAWYGPDHATRLQLVTRLLSRGYSLAVIRDLVDAWAAGRDLQDILGLESAVSGPQADHEPVVLTPDDLREVLRGDFSDAAKDALEAAGILERVPAGYRFPRGRMVLDTLPALVAAGLPTQPSLDLLVRVRSRLDATAADMVGFIVDSLLASAPHELPDTEQMLRLSGLVDPLAEAARAVTADLFALALRRAIDDAVDDFARRSLTSAASPDPVPIRVGRA